MINDNFFLLFFQKINFVLNLNLTNYLIILKIIIVTIICSIFNFFFNFLILPVFSLFYFFFLHSFLINLFYYFFEILTFLFKIASSLFFNIQTNSLFNFFYNFLLFDLNSFFFINLNHKTTNVYISNYFNNLNLNLITKYNNEELSENTRT